MDILEVFLRTEEMGVFSGLGDLKTLVIIKNKVVSDNKYVTNLLI